MLDWCIDMLNKRNKKILGKFKKANDLQKTKMIDVLQRETDNLIELLIEMKKNT